MAELSKKCCVYCLAEVSPLCFRCTECQDIELCPECFSAGAEIGHHRRYHGYQLVDVFLLFFGTLHSDAYIFPFLLCFSLLCF